MDTRYRNKPSIASRVRQVVSATADGTFIHVADIPGSRRAVESAISRLHLSGKVTRVHKGLYWKPGEDPFGDADAPDPIKVAIEVARDRGPGPAGPSAAHHLGLLDTAPPVAAVAVVGEPPINVEGVVFHSRANAQRVVCSFSEIAVLELLRDWPAHVPNPDFDRLIGAAAKARDRGELDANRLKVAARGESTSARELATQLVRQLGHVNV